MGLPLVLLIRLEVCTALLASGVFAFLDCRWLRYDADDFEEPVVKDL